MKKESSLSLVTKSWIWQKITVRWAWSQVSGLKCLWNVSFPCHQMTAVANRHILSCSTIFLPLTSPAAAFLPRGASGVFQNRFLTQAAFTFPINLSQEARVCLKLVLEIQPTPLQAHHTCSKPFSSKPFSFVTTCPCKKSLTQKANRDSSWFRPKIKHSELHYKIPEHSGGDLKHFSFWLVLCNKSKLLINS